MLPHACLQKLRATWGGAALAFGWQHRLRLALVACETARRSDWLWDVGQTPDIPDEGICWVGKVLYIQYTDLDVFCSLRPFRC